MSNRPTRKENFPQKPFQYSAGKIICSLKKILIPTNFSIPTRFIVIAFEMPPARFKVIYFLFFSPNKNKASEKKKIIVPGEGKVN